MKRREDALWRRHIRRIPDKRERWPYFLSHTLNGAGKLKIVSWRESNQRGRGSFGSLIRKESSDQKRLSYEACSIIRSGRGKAGWGRKTHFIGTEEKTAGASRVVGAVAS